MGSPRAFQGLKESFGRLIVACLVIVIALLFICPTSSMAQGSNIARDLANPFSSLWSIVNQINIDQIKGGLIRESQTEFNWNFQPVMPIPLTDSFNLVNRPVFSYYKTPYFDLTGGIGYSTYFENRYWDPTGGISYASGLGDTIFASLIVPNKSEGIIYGLGVTFIAPTASDSTHIGQGLWQAGPAAGLFYVSKQFVAGVFPQHWQSVSGASFEHPGTRHSNIQYGISYLPTPELTIASSANILADWTKDEANRWTVPLSIGASYLFTFGKLPVSIGINYQWVVRRPADIPGQESIIRLTITPVIPSPFAKKE